MFYFTTFWTAGVAAFDIIRLKNLEYHQGLPKSCSYLFTTLVELVKGLSDRRVHNPLTIHLNVRSSLRLIGVKLSPVGRFPLDALILQPLKRRCGFAHVLRIERLVLPATIAE